MKLDRIAILLLGVLVPTLASAAVNSNIIVVVNGLNCSTSAGANTFTAQSWSTSAHSTSATSAATFDNLAIGKLFDACSVALYSAATVHKSFSTVTLTERNATSGATTVIVQLTNATSLVDSLGGNQSNTSATEGVGFTYGRIQITDQVHGLTYCFDKTQNKAC